MDLTPRQRSKLLQAPDDKLRELLLAPLSEAHSAAIREELDRRQRERTPKAPLRVEAYRTISGGLLSRGGILVDVAPGTLVQEHDRAAFEGAGFALERVLLERRVDQLGHVVLEPIENAS